MTHVTCRLTAKNRDQLRNPTLDNRVWATFTFIVSYRNDAVAGAAAATVGDVAADVRRTGDRSSDTLRRRR